MIKFYREYMYGIVGEYVTEGKVVPCRAFLMLLFVWYVSQDLLRRQRCAIVGHRWLERSYAGPDNGYFELECVRCGCGVHKVLY